MTKVRGRWMSQLKKRENLSFLHFFVLFGPSTDWTGPPCTGEGVRVMFFTQSADSNGNIHTDTPQNNVLPASGRPSAQAGWPVTLARTVIVGAACWKRTDSGKENWGLIVNKMARTVREWGLEHPKVRWGYVQVC